MDQLVADACQSLSGQSPTNSMASAAIDLVQTRMGEAWGQYHRLFLETLQKQFSPELDRKLALSLARTGDQALEQLASVWSKLSNDARSTVLTEWTSRLDSIPMLLDTVGDGRIPREDIDAVSVQRLRQVPESASSKRVLELFGPPPGSDRAAIVRQALERWPSQADIQQGKMAYQKHCAVCHEPQTKDGRVQESVGPNLKGLIHWTNEAWMTAILDPHRSVEEKYWAFQARTEDEEIITGLKLREDDATIEWVNTAGRVERTPKSQLTDFRMSKLSLMPEGFEQLVAPEAIAGIITYLRSESQ
jgi:putative heme-binding domain-containing protein